MTASSEFTIVSAPPIQPKHQRRSRWAELLEECRTDPQEWRRLREPMTKSTATQIASDLRNATHRDPEKARVRGLRAGDVWEAAWGHDESDPDENNFYVWLRYMGEAQPEKPAAPAKKVTSSGKAATPATRARKRTAK